MEMGPITGGYKDQSPRGVRGGGRDALPRDIYGYVPPPGTAQQGGDFGTSHLKRGIQIEECSKPGVYYFNCMKASKYEQRFQLFIENKTCFLGS